ncbi:transposase [Streptomyces sp. NPDC127097]|uniref:transposase n=1 Tax=Streptomyces sp. NPDC127097 TaxID=3347136 RepID=UPI003653AFEC
MGDNPERLRSAASFAALCGAGPVEYSSGRQHRHRLNRGGDRRANAALYRIVQSRLRFDARTRIYYERASRRAKPGARSSAASNATPPGQCSTWPGMASGPAKWLKPADRPHRDQRLGNPPRQWSHGALAGLPHTPTRQRKGALRSACSTGSGRQCWELAMGVDP